MKRNVILITGTPGTGKTSVTGELSRRLGAHIVDLTDLALTENLIKVMDEKRETTVIDEKKMRKKVNQIIQEHIGKTVIVDGHYAPAIAPRRNTSHVFVLRRNPVELRKIMQNRRYDKRKIWENLASEILDVCLVEALNQQPKTSVCEVNVTGKTVRESAQEIVDILNGRRVCCVGIVDWLGQLESQGLLDEYLKI